MASVQKPIRLSPSGPIIENSSGGQLLPGPGMQLRLAEAKGTIGGAISGTLAELGDGTNMRATLLNPDPGKSYKATCQINSAEFAELAMQIERSVDGGTVWEAVGSDKFVGVTAVYRMAVINIEMGLGADDPGWDIPVGAPSLMIRCVQNSGSNTYVGAIATAQGFISLAELF